MKYSPEDEVVIDNRNLLILASVNYAGKEYIYAQEIDEENDDLLLNYFVYEAGEPDKLVTDESLRNVLLEMFIKELKKEM